MATTQSISTQLDLAAHAERLPLPQDAAPGTTGVIPSCSHNNSLQLMLVNSRSLKAHSAELKARTQIYKPSIIAVCESWLDASVGDSDTWI